MPVIGDWDLQLDVDQVLRGQGADPAIIRRRSPSLVAVAEKALQDGIDAIRPQVLDRRLRVERVIHDYIRCEGGSELRGALIGKHLAPSEEVIFLVCTIGPEIDERISRALDADMVYGLALDGLGSAAVEALANAACHRIEAQAERDGLETSIPLSPGMIGWPVERGQPQIFRVLEPAQIGVRVTSSWMMQPRKSLSMVLGVGPRMLSGSSCDYCAMRDTCRYQDHYAPK